MIDNKSILLVGNSGSITDSNLGSKIDEFDIVIRINEGKTKGWEKDAGLKFNIWSTYNPEKKFNKFVLGYKNRGYTDDNIKDILKDVKEIWYVGPKFEFLQPWHYDIYDFKNIIKRYESPLMLKEIIRNTQSETSTGFILIYLLSKMYDKIYIVGFDFFSHSGVKPKNAHYFTERSMELTEQRESLIRDLDGEWNFTKNLIDEGKIEILTLDTQIQKSKYIGKEIVERICENCNKSSMYYWWEHKICHYCEEYL